MQSQESYIANQDSKIAGLHARIDELNEHIVKMAMMPVYTHANETEKSLISDPDIFKGDEQDIKKSQELFDTFTAQVQLKMIGDKDCFSAEKERIIYVASRVSGPAYKNIRCWVTPVLEDKEGGFKSWQEIPEVLRHIYGVADKHAAAEREGRFYNKTTSHLSNFWHNSMRSLQTSVGATAPKSQHLRQGSIMSCLRLSSLLSTLRNTRILMDGLNFW